MSLNTRRIRDRIIQRQKKGWRHRETRTTLTDIEREAQLISDRVRCRMRRHRINEVDIDTVYYLGQMNELCQFCESFRFPLTVQQGKMQA